MPDRVQYDQFLVADTTMDEQIAAVKREHPTAVHVASVFLLETDDPDVFSILTVAPDDRPSIAHVLATAAQAYAATMTRGTVN